MKQKANPKTNAGYTIITSITLPEEEYVLGEKTQDTGEPQYVTWCCVNGTYYHGSYILDKDKATLSMYERAKNEIDYRIEQLKRKIQMKGEKQ